MAQSAEVAEVLEDLIETCDNGRDGYVHAAGQTKDPGLKSFFEEQSRQRGRYAAELASMARSLGVEAKRGGSLGATLHRAWFNLKADLGGGDHTILASVEQGEDRAKQAYERALRAPLPENLMALVREQFAGVKEAHDRVRSLRDRTAA